MMMTWPSYFIYAKAAILLEFKCPASSATSNSYMKSAIMMQLPQETQGNFSSNYLFPSYYTQTCKRKPRYTTREQTLERCPNLALASAFFAPGTKGPFSPGW